MDLHLPAGSDPLTTGRTYEQRIDTLVSLLDTLVSLLDALWVDRADVLGFSGGGPPSYLLAARHPVGVAALVEVDALSPTAEMAANPAMLKILFNRVGVGLYGSVLRTRPHCVPRWARSC